MDGHRLDNAFRPERCRDFNIVPEALTAEAFLTNEGVPLRGEEAYMPPPVYAQTLILSDPLLYTARVFKESTQEMKLAKVAKSRDIQRQNRKLGRPEATRAPEAKAPKAVYRK